MLVMKYNPSFLPDQSLIDSFCVRLAELESLLETLRETKGNSNVHRLVIGPRGSGKTMLVLRVAAEVRRDPDLSAKFFPLVLPEEHYEVSTCGEFWLECVGRLAASAPPESNGIDLRLTHEELRGVASDRDLEDRCLATLVDFARRADKRLLVTVENLNTLFADMADPDADWRLRKVLQTEPRIILLATATCTFAEIDHPEHALYNFFGTLELSSLRTEECAALWDRVSVKETVGREIRSIEILTGGSPRLIATIAQFGGGLSSEKLLDELMRLVDDHTEYFKSHIEALPAQERRVYLALAEAWKPATAREVAKLARLQSSHCSAHLKRLASRGAVVETGGTPRRKEYYLAERLYNIYYLVRKRGGPGALVEALIRFMASFYSVSEQMGRWAHVVNESEESSSDSRPLVADATARLIEILPRHRTELLGRLPESFTGAAGEAPLLQHTGPALETYSEIIDRYGESTDPAVVARVVEAIINKSQVLSAAGKDHDALRVYDPIEKWLENGPSGRLANDLEIAILNRAAIAIKVEAPGKAIEIANRVISNGMSDSARNRARALWIRAEARYAIGEIGGCHSDIDEALVSLPRSDAQLDLAINQLVLFGIRLGLDQVLTSIEESPSADLLLPLSTALAQELGRNPRVSKEVAEVAHDLRDEIANVRTNLE